MSSSRSILLALTLALVAGAFAGCAKKTAQVELQAAEDAEAAARAKKAKDCAKETYAAAEAALAQARQLATDGDVEGAKQKANEAKGLYEQAGAASKPGCDQPPPAEEDPNAKAGKMTDASSNLDLGAVLQTVYFDYNDASIREDSKAVLSKVAATLAKGNAKIEIEGHCDVRGSTEYNLSLGERRARSVQKYLMTQGVKVDQLDIISYGEERPVDLGLTEDAHQKNRRAELKKMP